MTQFLNHWGTTQFLCLRIETQIFESVKIWKNHITLQINSENSRNLAGKFWKFTQPCRWNLKIHATLHAKLWKVAWFSQNSNHGHIRDFQQILHMGEAKKMKIDVFWFAALFSQECPTSYTLYQPWRVWILPPPPLTQPFAKCSPSDYSPGNFNLR